MALGPRSGLDGEERRGESETRLPTALTGALTGLAAAHGLTLNTLVQGAWAILLSRYTGEERVLFGTTRACRKTIERADSVVGMFMNTIPVGVHVRPESSVVPWLKELRQQQIDVRSYEHTPLSQVQRWSELPAGSPILESVVVFDHAWLEAVLRRQDGAFANRTFRFRDQPSFPVTLYAYGESRLLLSLVYDRRRVRGEAAERMLGQLRVLLEGMAANPASLIRDLPMLTTAERHLQLREWNATKVDYPRETLVHELIEAQVARTPERVAAVTDDRQMTYDELNRRANQLARRLRALGVGPDVLVGLHMERSLEMLVALLAVLKAGGAYVPLDPDFPANRLAFMVEDANLSIVLSQASLAAGLPVRDLTVVPLDSQWEDISREPDHDLARAAEPDALAYVVYTSGSTGKPKGVMIEHRHVVNFFAGMDARIDHEAGGVWLAVTSLSFDISVLELFWTLARGFTVVLYRASGEDAVPAEADPLDQIKMAFSLFYFASDEGEKGREKYKLLLEGAKFADQHEFEAVWTPERHFHAFGGLYPNPSVIGAAVAAVTSRVQILAGSCVLPLHHPIRVAEEWSVVDNLSDGRVGISFASGWRPNDFVLSPANYADRKATMFRDIETVRKLWRGERVAYPNAVGELAEVQILPRPVQPELPVWVTTAGNAETFRQAGEAGAFVLTHLLGQTVEELGAKIAAYHDAWTEHGHQGRGKVTLMLHTFVGGDDEAVKAVVREPMKAYLRSSISLIKGYASSWTAYKRAASWTSSVGSDAYDQLSETELEGLLDFAFERYFEMSGLFGTPQTCLRLVRKLKAANVDELACLIDFGVDSDEVLCHLDHLNVLRGLANPPRRAGRRYRIPEALEEHAVTHLQCTPSMAQMMLMHDETRRALGSPRHLLIGGEGLPLELVRELREVTRADIINMYGPTETTIWSSTYAVDGEVSAMSVGRPITNTEFYVLDRALKPLPIGATGELYIGGASVARGYLGRPELTKERFIRHPFSDADGARLYRTGDLARYRDDGNLDLLGRVDHQIKLQGHRIELGEVEAILQQHAAVSTAVVIPREDSRGDKRLVAYVVQKDAIAPSDLAADLRQHLSDTLPEYMVPASFVTLDVLPLTPNKKVDRTALPAPDQLAPQSRAALVPAANELERAIARVWVEALGVPEVGMRDNFFDLGGHSLLAVRVHGRVRKLGRRDLSVTDVFRFPTIRALAAHLVSDEDSGAAKHASRR